MNKKEQILDVLTRIRNLSDKHNLEISDEEINEWIKKEYESKLVKDYLNEQQESALRTINENMGTSFTSNDSMLDILDYLSERWNEL